MKTAVEALLDESKGSASRMRTTPLFTLAIMAEAASPEWRQAGNCLLLVHSCNSQQVAANYHLRTSLGPLNAKPYRKLTTSHFSVNNPWSKNRTRLFIKWRPVIHLSS
jgi:hypothetical protein